MKIPSLTYFILITTLWVSIVDSMKASFFGASYVAMPIQEAKISTNIRLRFRTQQPSSIILLAAGRNDYCLLSLENERIKLVFHINEQQNELWSPKQLLLNDLNWHDIAISRYETNVTLQVDEHFIRANLSPTAGELNVHFGVFIGGVGETSQPYLNNLENYRGCMSELYYNNIHVFKRAQQKLNYIEAFKMTWSCAAEFDASMDESISFVDENGFMMMSKPITPTGETWSLDFRTIEPTGGVLYNLGLYRPSDYMALEILDEKLRLLVGKGANAVELISNKTISDGQWHSVMVKYNPVVVEITVDGVTMQGPFANGSSQVIELGEEFFIGGIDTPLKKRAFMKNIRAGGVSFKGCIRNIFVDNQHIGLPSMKITEGVTVDCIYDYKCIEKTPCILSGRCEHKDVEDFICHCDQAFCIKAEYTEPYKIYTRSAPGNEIELVRVSPIQILEGESIFMSQQFIYIMVDYNKTGTTESGILFHIAQHPKHGRISKAPFTTQHNSNNSTIIKQFTYADLLTDQIKYIHNGQEQLSDHMTIDLQFSNRNSHLLPDSLQGRHRFVLHVNVTPVNDPPTLNIPSNQIIRVTQGIPKKISNEIFNGYDPDSSPASLIYTVENLPRGNFERGGKIITSFTQNDVNTGIITFTVNDTNYDNFAFEFSISVSDGMETSSPVLMQVSVVPLHLTMVNNTGLILVHKSSAILTPWNLSFVTNSEDDIIDIRFDITQQPQFGVIQRYRPVDTAWIGVEMFTSNQIIQNQIRYLHTKDIPNYDEFKFTASLGQLKTAKFDFRLTFTKLKIGVQIHGNLGINGTKDTVISAEYLFHQTTPLITFTKNIIYTVIRPPKYGGIYASGHPKFAEAMDSFTQYDIDRNAINYQTFMTTYSSFFDTFDYTVSAPECEMIDGQLQIIFNPNTSLANQLSYQARETIVVNEGDRALLSKRHFQVHFNRFSVLQFHISEAPKHGVLCNYNVHEERIITIDEFSLENLYLGDVYYCHDDSESERDSFKILILSDEETNFQFVSEINAEIHLQNDNAPSRLEERIFHVVRGENKTITSADLKYEDPDVDTRENEIYYSRIVVHNGEFWRNGYVVDYFYQKDIDNGDILLKHVGADYGNATFMVSDGVHISDGVLEIQASDPFIKVCENNASIVQEGKMVTIRSSDISIETNLNSKPDDIVYTILERPKYGIVTVGYSNVSKPNTASVKTFSQQEIEHGDVIYWNIEVASMDKIKYRVTTKGVWTEGEIMVRIYPGAYWETLQIRRNQTLYVEESTSVIISRNVLEILHPNISPGDITYLVTQSPQHGYLEIQSITSDDEYNCKVFDQSTINSEKMFYIQAGVNQSSDYFIFDVTNGITWLRDLMLRIVIIPETIYIKTRVVIVEEGKNIQIQPEDMLPYSEYYANKILEYRIMQQPLHGQVRSGKSKVNRFTQKQLEAGVVYYVHDGSENLTDCVQIIAVTRNKESLPYDLKISIFPVNDEPPVIVTNTGLHMWIGGRAVIKNTDLMAQDYDTTPENLKYITRLINGGYLADKSAFGVKILTFSQAQINEEEIYFVHDNNTINGRIVLFVTDGAFNTTEQTLMVTANPVTLQQIKNENLHVFPMTRKTVTAEQLLFRCSDHDRDVHYRVSRTPEMGKILYENQETGMTVEVVEFFQRDIDNGRIMYEHLSPMVELTSNDSFYFDVSAYLANSLHDETFHIDISVSSGGLQKFLPVPKIILNEGDSSPIRLDLTKVLEYLEKRARISSPELSIEVYPPQYGFIDLLDEENKDHKLRFTLQDFYETKVVYRHDHSDTTDDKISMSIFLLPGQIFLCNLTIPIVVRPINDQPINLVTTSPSLAIVEGENKTITKLDLYTEDADTSPVDVIYDVLGQAPGSLLKLSNEGFPSDLLVYGNKFSQLDINDERIIYSHSGNNAAITTFLFSVTDGKSKSAYINFKINILPIVILPDTQSSEVVTMLQGLTVAILEPRHIPVNTNVNKNRLMYNITSTPSGGLILLRNNPTLRFSQIDLENRNVSYTQSDMSLSNDSFQVNAYVPATNYATQIDIPIVVEPFISINQISLMFGDKVRIRSVIPNNTTDLKLNRYNPKVTITRKPKYGKFRKIIRNSGETETENTRQEITSFTYKELNSGSIYYIAKKAPPNIVNLNDSFEYILTLRSVQPGRKVVPIEIYSQMKKTTDPNDDRSVVIAEASNTLNYILVPAVITIGVLLLMIASGCIICLIMNSKKKCNSFDKNQPPPLPRPPDIMMMNNNQMYAPSEADSGPATASSTPLPVLSNVPHCKVYPIGLDTQINDSELDEMLPELSPDLNNESQNFHGRWPYGEDSEQWSTSDMANEVSYSNIAQPQQRSNPLLRRNQYWV